MGRSLEALLERSTESYRAKSSEIHREARIKGLCAAVITACLLIFVCYAIIINMSVQMTELREHLSATEQKLAEMSDLVAEYERENHNLQRELDSTLIELDSALVELDEAHVQALENVQTIADLGEKLKEAEDLLVLYYDNVVYINDIDAYYHRKSCDRISQWDTEPFIISQISPYGYSACPECFPH